MAKLVFQGRTAEVPDGENILTAAEELGVPFGCRNALCQTCRVTVVSGGGNLLPPNEAERAHELPASERLCCQAVIKNGTVEISR